MKYIPNSVSSHMGRAILIGQKHSPTILFGAGVVGVVTATVLACRATLKLEDVLKESEEKLELAHTLQHKDYSEKDRQQDIAIVYVRNVASITKLYAPAVIVGVASIAALTGSHRILTNRNAALTAAYAALDRGFKEYRKRVVDEYGEDKDREFRYGSELAVRKDEKTGKEIEFTRVGPKGHSIYAKFFDQSNSSWQKTPEYNRFFLQCQQTYANDKLRAQGHMLLNDVYDLLGFDRTKAGCVVGWIMSKDPHHTGDNYIDFGIFDGDDWKTREFVNGREGAILLDFNVDGVVYDKI